MNVHIFPSLMNEKLMPVQIGEVQQNTRVVTVIQFSEPTDLLVLTEGMEDRLLKFITEGRERNARVLGNKEPK